MTDQQRLSFMGKQLNDDQKLPDYGIQSNSTLQLELDTPPLKYDVDYETDHEFIVPNANDVWQEQEDDGFHMYPGGVRNYYYRSEGRLMRQRSLNVAAILDQTQLSLSGIEADESRGGVNMHEHSTPPDSSFQSDHGVHLTGSNSIHEPLSSASCTRFLELLPGDGARVECRLHSCDLATKLRYEAISYSSNWHSIRYSTSETHYDSHAPTRDSSSEQVLCNGRVMRTSTVLVEALRQLSLTSKSRLFWVADLCVDSSDVADRNHHTRLAGKIFQEATRVIIWLGRQWTTSDETAFASICKIVNTWRTSCRVAHQLPPAKYFVQGAQVGRHAGQRQDIRPLGTNDAWHSATQMFRKRWFSAAWSVKETAMARSIVVMLGNHEISWDLVGFAAAILRESFGQVSCAPQQNGKHGKPAFPEPGILQAYFLYRLSRSQKFFPPLQLTFYQLLSLTRDFGSKDLHDKIYTTCGVATLDSTSSAIIVDYNKDIDTIYQGLALLFTRGEGSISFLADVRNPHGSYHMKPGMSNAPRLQLRGPSWVPRWDCRLTETISPLKDCAAFSAGTQAQMRIQVSSDGSKLAILGVIVDTVKSAVETRVPGTYWRGEEDRDSSFPKRAHTIDELLAIHGVQPQHLQPLAMTLTCGKDWNGEPVSDTKMHVADFARCLLRRGLLWSLRYASGPSAGNQDDSAAKQSPGAGDNVLTAQALEAISQGGHADRFLDAAATVGDRRAYFVTAGGYFGLGPDSMYNGDILCVLYGLKVPCIIRPAKEADCYKFLGECYSEEIMHGEALDCIGGREESWIVLE